MYTVRLRSLVLASGLVLSVGCMVITGCGGDDSGAGAADTGNVQGRTIYAKTGQGLGGVTVQIGTGGENNFTMAASAESTTPDGDYTITDIPPGSYDTLHVVPDPAIGDEIWIDVSVTVTAGQTVSLDPILVTDETPPDTP